MFHKLSFAVYLFEWWIGHRRGYPVPA